MKSTKIILLMVFVLVGNLYSQLEISLYTDKAEYEYGELIKLNCKITNTADTTSQFFAGNHNSCQAEFSFNDFNSWEHEGCLPTTQLLVFKPYASKIYTWLIDPMATGLPNKEGMQQIIGYYYFDLLDTINIEAPQFLGGRLSVGYSKANADSIQQIKDSLGIEVLSQSDYGDRFNESWQVIGHQIDSIISRYDQDTIFNFVEKAIWIEYDSIRDENPLAFYPLHVGDERQYLVEERNNSRDTSYYIISKIVGSDTCDGREYFLLSDGLVDCLRYIRIDPANATVWEIICGDENECMIDSLEMIPNTTGSISNDCHGFVYCVADTTKVIFNEEKRIKAFHWKAPLTCVYCPYRDYQYAEGIGQIYSKTVNPAPEGFEDEYRIETLVYAKIDGVEYGEIPDTNDTWLDYFPLQIGNRWQYSEAPGHISESQAVRDTLMSNNEVYTLIEGDLVRGYYRKEGARVYRYISIDSSDNLVYDFSLEVGDTLKIEIFEEEDTVITTVFDAGITNIFGQDRNYMIFHRESLNSTGDGEAKIVDGLGQTLYAGEVFSYGLTGAVIDGVTYGKIVHVDKKSGIPPIEYSLSQNYPNPFNPSTIIKYQIPMNVNRESSNVKLIVYDVLGRKVTTLVNKEQSAGNFEVEFDASKLTSGIYFYKLQSGSFVESRKMVLLR